MRSNVVQGMFACKVTSALYNPGSAHLVHRPLHELHRLIGLVRVVVAAAPGQGPGGVPSPSLSSHTSCLALKRFCAAVLLALLPQNLEQVLQQLSLLPQGKGLEEYPALEKEYRILWADHGDAIATQYAGEVIIGGLSECGEARAMAQSG